MTAEPFQNLLDLCDRIAALHTNVFEHLERLTGSNDTKLDFSRRIPGSNQNLSGTDLRLGGMVDLIRGFEGTENIDLVPVMNWGGLNDQLAKINAELKVTSEILDNIELNDGPGEVIPDNFLISSNNGAVVLDLADHLKPIIDACDQALQIYYWLAVPLKGEGYHDFSKAVQSLSERLNGLHARHAELDSLFQNARTGLEHIQEKFSEISGIEQEASNLRAETERVKGEAELDRKSIGEYQADGTQQLATIRETSQQAETLKATVEGYSSQFDAFQAQLDQRDQTFQKGTQEQERLIGKVKEIEEEIGRLNQDANDMLGGATVAGLAGSFGKIRDEVTKELNSARNSFYWSIGFLFLSSLPLMLYVVPGLREIVPGPELGPGLNEAPTAGLIAQIIARLIILIPAAWMAKFTAARHASLFRLREHYAYKYSIASSVDGFKKQAEQFKDEIAGLAFARLTDLNPADKMDSSAPEESHPSPLTERLMRLIGLTKNGKSS